MNEAGKRTIAEWHGNMANEGTGRSPLEQKPDAQAPNSNAI